MSTYNSENYLKKSIESILNQSFSNFEFLIIDDASVDNSFNYLKKYAAQDSRIKLFKNKNNVGLTKSLNILSKEAKGIYIARQDSDDVSLNRRFEMQIEYINKKNLNACTTLAKSVQNKKILHLKTTFLPFNQVLKYKNPFIHGSLMIDKNTFELLGRYNEDYYYAQDYYLLTKLVSKKFKISILKKVLYHLNQENNISSNFKKEQELFAKKVRNEYLKYEN